MKPNSSAEKDPVLLQILFFSTLLFVLGLFLGFKLTHYIFDDAYIHMRIAQNFANYNTPYFNPAEKVFSSSSFIWTVLLAVLIKLKLELIPALVVLNSFFTAAASGVWAVLYHQGNKRASAWWLILLFQVAVAACLISSSIGLMETPFALFLLGTGFLLVSNDRPMGWVVVALACFTRYEIFSFVGMAVIVDVLNSWSLQRIKTAVAWLGGTTIAIAAVIYSYFSTLIPNTIRAKAIVYQIRSASVARGLFFDIFPRIEYPFLGLFYGHKGFQTQIFKTLETPWIMLLLILFAVSLILFNFKHFLKEFQNSWLAIGFPLATITLTFVYVLKGALVFAWYLPLFTFPFIFALFSFLSYSISHPKEGNTTRPLLTKASIGMLFVITSIICLNQYILLGQTVYSATVDLKHLPGIGMGMRVDRYLQVGSLLYQKYPQARLLTSEIGALGYAFKGEIIDGVGLISPQALKYHPMNVPEQRANGATGAIPAKMVYDTMPELVVSLPRFVQEFDRTAYQGLYTRLSMPVLSDSEMLRTGVNEIWGSDQIYIYFRNDVADASQIEEIRQQLKFTD